jgi:predicted DCC family thiol-disulfide oxidoreductase YuxK
VLPAMNTTEGKTLVLYDGVCALCNGLVRFLLRHDSNDEFRFAPLQSEFARNVLAKSGVDAADLNTVCVLPPDGGLLTKSSAALYLLNRLGWPWTLLRIIRILPVSLRDFFYDLIARSRYRMFGKYDACPLPRPEYRHKFLA